MTLHSAKASRATSKKKGKTKQNRHKIEEDSNAIIYVPKSTRNESTLIAQSNSRMNSKKKKRLDKYIDKKLKHEERLMLFEKLSQSQSQLTSTLHLQSSSTLGTGKHFTAHERLEKEEDKETRKMIERGEKKRGKDVEGGSTVGSALKRNSDGSVVAPRISSKRTFSGWNLKPPPSLSQDPIPEPPLATAPPPKKKLKTSHPADMRGPLGEDLILPTILHPKPNFEPNLVHRPDPIQASRLQLPIVSEEQPIMETILHHPVVVICGETGSGKTTQVPQFLFEAGWGSSSPGNVGMIGITQPRRVAAISTSQRVAYELSLPPSRISYQIRYDATTSPNTCIKFMTDGVLLRELMDDFLLKRYSVVVVDEAHERSLNTDLLVGVLARVVKLREEMWKEGKEGVRPLRLIIMSATLRVSDFTSNPTLFPTPPPIINISTRQHSVTIHFNRRTPSDYIGEAIKKTAKIHCRLPPGGILIFLTGQNEIMGVCRKLESRFGKKALEERRKRKKWRVGGGGGQVVVEDEGTDQVINSALADVEAEDLDLGLDDDLLAVDIDEGIAGNDPEALDSGDDEETRENTSLGIDIEETEVPMHIVPLYSLLPREKQIRVFQPPPDGHRLVVISTNVAETSITIPGIRYVVDCGRSKERRYDANSGIQNFQISWISKASAAQRAGRAGRTGPGHCYRLYSSALFEHHFEAFSQPEILRMPIEGVVLQMKSMGIDAVVNFPFPTPPDQVTLRNAEAVLTHLGALTVPPVIPNGGSEVVLSGTLGGRITDLGKAMSLFPLSPRFSRIIVGGRQHRCLPYVICIVSALSVGDPFIREEGISEDTEVVDGEFEEDTAHLHSETVRAKEAHRLRRKAFFQSQQMHGSLGNFLSDLFRLLSVVGAYSHAGGGQNFCADHFVRPKAMEEIHKLRSQLSNIVEANFPGVDAGFVPKLPPPSDFQLKVLRQLLAAAFIDQVAVRKDIVDKGSASGNKYATSRGVQYRAIGIAEDVFIHPSSVLTHNAPPEYVVYHEVVRTSRVWLKGVTVINPLWLPPLGKPSLCSFSRPAKNSAGIEMVIPRFGPDRWELPPIKADSI